MQLELYLVEPLRVLHHCYYIPTFENRLEKLFVMHKVLMQDSNC